MPMKHYSMGALLLIAVIAAGCGSEGESVNDVSQDESRARLQKQMNDNPNMPPQARAAAQRMQGMGSDLSKNYSASQPKKAGN